MKKEEEEYFLSVRDRHPELWKKFEKEAEGLLRRWKELGLSELESPSFRLDEKALELGYGQIEKSSSFSDAMISVRPQIAEFEERIKGNFNYGGWKKLTEILREAQADEQINASPGACEFLELVVELASDAWFATTAEQAFQPLEKALKSEGARKAAKAGNNKYREAEEWVVGEWKKDKAAYNGNKSDFARHYVRRISNEMDGLDIKERTIRERWLKDL